MRILFCNIGWMNNYNGQTEDDRIENGGSFIDENGYGIEEYTFQNINGYYYGGTGLSGNMNIERIEGVNKDSSEAENVLVVWVAKKTNEENSRIIGWYKNATIYREFKEFDTLNNSRPVVYYRIKAKAEDGILLVPVERTFIMPRANKSEDGIGMGRSNIWYADKEKAKPFIDKVVDYINGFNRKPGNFMVTDRILYGETDVKLNSIEDYIDKAYKLSEENNNRTALEYANRAISMNDKNPYSYNCKGNVLLDIGLCDIAIENFKKALELDKHYIAPIFNIGLAYGMYGDFYNSLKYFEEYLKIDSDDEDAKNYKNLLEKNICNI